MKWSLFIVSIIFKQKLILKNGKTHLKYILTSERAAQHQFAGQNILQVVIACCTTYDLFMTVKPQLYTYLLRGVMGEKKCLESAIKVTYSL